MFHVHLRCAKVASVFELTISISKIFNETNLKQIKVKREEKEVEIQQRVKYIFKKKHTRKH